MISVLIDTSNRNLSAAIAVDGKIIDSVEYDAWQKQSEFLVDELSKLFERNGLNPKDIGKVIAAKGPGSYTGVRIAVSVAKVLAFALNVPLYLVSSLWDMKDGDKPSICLMNARSKRSYVGVYEGNKALLNDSIWTNDEVLAYIQEHPSFSVMGDTEYLNIPAKKPDLFKNLVEMGTKENEVEDVLSAKPVYLKDLA